MGNLKQQKICLTISERDAGFRDFRGLGVQWDPHNVHPVTESEWKMITDRADAMCPAFVRLMIYAPTYCSGLDENGEPIYRLDSPGVQALLRELDYLESRHIEVVLGEWEAPGRFGGPFEGVETGDPRWTKIIVGFLEYLLNEKKYTCIHYFNYINEANSDWSLCADWEKWRCGILSLSQALKEHNLADRIGITGPDSVWDEGDIWIQNVASDEQIHDAVSLYDIHMYPTIEEIREGKVLEHAKRNHSFAPDRDFYMTEVGMVTGKTMGDSQPNVREYSYGVIMADIAAQVINGGLNALSIWDLDDAMHDQGNGYPKTDIRSLKLWGFFNSVAGRVFNQPEEEKLRPHFFTWSLMCRFFRPGSKVLLTSEESDTVRTVAMRDTDGKLRIMIVNHHESANDTTIYLPQTVSTKWNRYVYCEEGRKVDENGYPLPVFTDTVSEGQIRLNMPAMSVIFLIEN